MKRIMSILDQKTGQWKCRFPIVNPADGKTYPCNSSAMVHIYMSHPEIQGLEIEGHIQLVEKELEPGEEPFPMPVRR